MRRPATARHLRFDVLLLVIHRRSISFGAAWYPSVLVGQVEKMLEDLGQRALEMEPLRLPDSGFEVSFQCFSLSFLPYTW